MAQRKHKKRKQHTKSKSAASQQILASEEVSQKADEKKKGFFTKDKPTKAVEKKKEAKPAKGANGKPAKPGMWTRFKNYVKAVRTEMQRVVWPTRPELINASLIVIGAIVFFGVFIAIIDNVIILPLSWISSLGA